MNTKLIGRIVGFVFLVVMFVTIRKYSAYKSNLIPKAGSGSEIITIDDDLVQIPTLGKDMTFESLLTNGIKPSYTVYLGDDRLNPYVFPGTNIPPEKYYKNDCIWVTLNRNQGLREARFKFTRVD